MKTQHLNNPRFVWAVGSIHEQFTDIPDNLSADNNLVLWDRQEKQAVATIHNPFAQAMCLETTETGCHPFSAMEDWFNSLSDDALESEGMPTTCQTYDRC